MNKINSTPLNSVFNPFPFKGLEDKEVSESVKKWGTNVMAKGSSRLWKNFLSSFLDPMFILLILAASLYYWMGKTAEAFYLGVAVVAIGAISFYQQRRSDRALDALEKLTSKKCKVIRNNAVLEILREDVVIGDFIVAEEGAVLPADGVVVQANDFAVNEALLTGEPAPIWKYPEPEKDTVFAGTVATSGLAVYKATAIGKTCRIGKIATGLKKLEREASPLGKQIRRFVFLMSIVGLLIFLLVWGLHILRSGKWLDSLLQALTLAMSVIPEEIPVAFTTFMALGSWRLMKRGILAKDVITVEALGVATVICLDKTGTITLGEMKLQKLYVWNTNQFLEQQNWGNAHAKELLTWAMLSSEVVPFDPMEKNIQEAYIGVTPKNERASFEMQYEYPLAGSPPMMTHVYKDANGNQIIAAKGAPEKIATVCKLTPNELQTFSKVVNALGGEGLRLLAVAKGKWHQEILPAKQEQLKFELLGIVAFYDPPKKGIGRIFKRFNDAGIKIKILTGDNMATTKALALQAGLAEFTHGLNGEEISSMSDVELEQALTTTPIMTRLFPEVKLRIIEALKRQGNIVAMTGDGVNDALALKAADIGIAMGERGAEIAREAATLVLTDDNLNKILEAIAMGRQIRKNLKTAISYIVAIHIPIILIVTLPLLLQWVYPDILSPLHVVFLELVMGPTCSIVYENEPLDRRQMYQPPKKIEGNLLTIKELSHALILGIVITLAVLSVYRMGVWLDETEAMVRTQIFTALIAANITLTFANRQTGQQFWRKRKVKNPRVTFVVLTTIGLYFMVLAIAPLRDLFGFVLLEWQRLLLAGLIGFCGVIWYIPAKKWLL